MLTACVINTLGVEMFHQILDRAEAGDQMGALVKGVKRHDIRRGQILAKKDSIKMYNNFDAKVLSRILPEYYIYKNDYFYTIISSLIYVLVKYKLKNVSIDKNLCTN